MVRVSPGKKPTREPTIAFCCVAWCLISFRGPQQKGVSTRIIDEGWGFESLRARN